MERRIQKAEEQSAKGAARRERSPPAFRMSSRRTFALLYDLQLLAYQSDLTRVITFMYGREQTGRPYPQIGVPGAASSGDAPPERPGEDGEVRQHSAVPSDVVRRVSGEAAEDRRMATGRCSITRFCFLAPASATATGTRTVRCRHCLLGGGARALKGGRHLVYPEHTPLTNLQLTLLNKLGVPVEKLGDSNGQFKELSELS